MRKLTIIGVVSLLCLLVSMNAWSADEPDPVTDDYNFEGQTVNVMLMASGPVLNYGDFSADFEERTGATVNLSIVPVAEYDAKGDTELLTSRGAWDVVWIPWRTYLRWIEANWFAPMDEYLNDAELVDEELLDLDGFFPASLAALQVDGQQMALPILAGGVLLYYRMDIFEEYGIDGPPDTWEELAEIAATIHTDEVAGIGMRTANRGGGVGYIFPGVLEAYGGSIVADFPSDMHPTLDQPEAMEAARYYADLLQNYTIPGGLTAHWTELVTAYQQGQLAMLPEAYLLSGQILDPEKSLVVNETGFALIPAGPAGRVAQAAVHGLGIPANAPNPALGYKYIEWALSEEIQLRNCLENTTSSATRDAVMANSEYLEKFGYNDGEFSEVLAETLAVYADPYYRPMSPEWRQVESEIGIAMSNILTGQESVEEALTKANDALNEIYIEAGYYTE